MQSLAVPLLYMGKEIMFTVPLHPELDSRSQAERIRIELHKAIREDPLVESFLRECLRTAPLKPAKDF